MSQAGFGPEIPESKRMQKQTFDCAATELGYKNRRYNDSVTAARYKALKLN